MMPIQYLRRGCNNLQLEIWGEGMLKSKPKWFPCTHIEDRTAWIELLRNEDYIFGLFGLWLHECDSVKNSSPHSISPKYLSSFSSSLSLPSCDIHLHCGCHRSVHSGSPCLLPLTPLSSSLYSSTTLFSFLSPKVFLYYEVQKHIR